MVDELKPVISQPGVFRILGDTPETSPGSGIYVLEGGVETSPGSGIFSFPMGPAFEVTTTAKPPTAVLTFDAEDLPGSTHTIVVTRSYGNVTETLRDAWNRFAAGGAVLTDSEIPVGVPVTYQAQAFDTDGTPLGSTGTVTTQIDSDIEHAWFSDPLNPTLVVEVEMKLDFADTLTRTRQVQTYQVGNRLVALLGAQGKLDNIALRVQTKSIEDADLLAQILASTSVLVRTAPPIRLPRLLYVVVPTVNEIAQDIQVGGEWVFWDLVGQEVSATTLDILVPVVTWQSFLDAFPGATWADVIAFYAGKTWFDVIKEFSAGGA